MFKALMSVLVLSVSIFAQANLSTTVYSILHGEDSGTVFTGFYASSFVAQVSYCYVGEPEKVCAEVSRGEAEQKEKYRQGAHDYFQVLRCENDHDQVTVEVALYTDYSEGYESRTLVFGECDL